MKSRDGAYSCLVLGRLAAPALAGDLLIDLSLRSPGLLSLPVVGDIVVERLGDRIDAPAGSDTTLVTVEIASGSSSRQIATQLRDAGVIGDETGFLVAVARAGLDGNLQAGLFRVSASMTPTEIAVALTQPYREPTIAVQLRAGLRLEQIVAQVGTLDLPFEQQELLTLLSQLHRDDERLDLMSNAMRSIARPEAAADVARLVMATARQ